jgi:hypothetical protein
MLCRECTAVEQRINVDTAQEAEIPDQLCSRCGHLIGTAEVVQRVHKKQSQLARFGLAGSRDALLKRREGGD